MPDDKDGQFLPPVIFCQKESAVERGSGDRLSGCAKIFGQKCQGGRDLVYLILSVNLLEVERLEWFNSSLLPAGIDKTENSGGQCEEYSHSGKKNLTCPIELLPLARGLFSFLQHLV